MITIRRKLTSTALGLSQHCCRHRFKSSSASFNLPIPESIRETVKTSIVEEATKSNSPIWSDSRNEKQHIVNDDRKKLDNDVAYVNGQNSFSKQNKITIDHEITPGIFEDDDPLNDWNIYDKPKYWPDLPPGVSMSDPFLLSKVEINSLAQSIREDLLGTDHPVLNKAAAYFFDSDDNGGKKVRPMMVILLSRALSEHSGPTRELSEGEIASVWSHPFPWQRQDLPKAQRRLAEISELIHTASLFHDDVIDEAETRRGKTAVHQVFGNKMAILAGDYLLARASISLARLRQVDVVESMSTIIEHLVRGEVMQMKGSSDNAEEESRLNYYLRKNYFKTGSLMANSCRSTALLGNYSQGLVDLSYRYGKHIGMAFQLVDDILDYEGSFATMGKSALSDLKAGLATAPVLFALQQAHEEADASSTYLLQTMIDRKFSKAGDVDEAVNMVYASKGIERTKELAQTHAELAMNAVLELNQSEYRDALVHLAYKVVDRTR
mmetsp:Transcript_6261/g.9626  ORF Transcript_6261/g.9626 Transcript_6261/m.9626 type:complete len:494 (-) Transcript_6261:77-1558(-)|eukprot:CAMPEP_0178915746 /NCGR_PEP_ID=MMETSP0786-20121207/12212_1 /TAXON_ID=186022 /ORGANISM="Thalassionema frauenfeldii, Strain CCMP 1798" /LENGTH=493 /DNA_ID=CAMNT_0020588919 /DNA_START=206 /DNA_END=1687 /DNA_ORIENTATION=-